MRGGGFRAPRPKLTGNAGKSNNNNRKGANTRNKRSKKSRNDDKDDKMEMESPDSLFGDEMEDGECGGIFDVAGGIGGGGGGVSFLNSEFFILMECS